MENIKKFKLFVNSVLQSGLLVFFTIVSVNVTFSSTSSGKAVQFVESGISKSQDILQKKAGYTLRVYHDGYWWIQCYDDHDSFIYEYLDPDQS